MDIEEIKRWRNQLGAAGVAQHNIDRIDWLLAEVERLIRLLEFKTV